MAEAASHFVPDYRDQPQGSVFWRTDTPRGIELAAGYVGVRWCLRRSARMLPLNMALYAASVIGFWWWAGARSSFPWTAMLVGTLLIMPAFWLGGALHEGRQGLAVRIGHDVLEVHRQHALRRGRWEQWRRGQIARVHVNWEGWIVLLGPDGKRIGKFGGEPGRADMTWLAQLIRGRLDLTE